MSFSQFHQDTSRPSPSPAKALGCAMASSCHARNQPLCTISPSPAMTGTQRFLGLRDSWDSESYQIGTPKAPFQLCFNLANSLEEPRLSRLPGYFQFTDAPPSSCALGHPCVSAQSRPLHSQKTPNLLQAGSLWLGDHNLLPSPWGQGAGTHLKGVFNSTYTIPPSQHRSLPKVPPSHFSGKTHPCPKQGFVLSCWPVWSGLNS